MRVCCYTALRARSPGAQHWGCQWQGWSSKRPTAHIKLAAGPLRPLAPRCLHSNTLPFGTSSRTGSRHTEATQQPACGAPVPDKEQARAARTLIRNICERRDGKADSAAGSARDGQRGGMAGIWRPVPSCATVAPQLSRASDSLRRHLVSPCLAASGAQRVLHSGRVSVIRCSHRRA